MAKSPQVLICLSADASTLKAPRVAFRRQLWSEQALPDNYTDETFLRSLKISVHGPIRSYWQVVREASAVTQQMDTVVVVAMVSAYLYKASNLQYDAVHKACLASTASCKGSVCEAVHVGLDVSRAPVMCCSGSDGAGWGFLYSSRQSELHHLCQARCSSVGPLDSWCVSDVASAADTHQLGQQVNESLRHGQHAGLCCVQGCADCADFVVCYSDSIVALVCGLLTMHLYLHDYTFVDQMTDTLTGSMSMTAATFASVLIASQLKTQMQVFSQARTVPAFMLALLICISVT